MRRIRQQALDRAAEAIGESRQSAQARRQQAFDGAAQSASEQRGLATARYRDDNRIAFDDRRQDKAGGVGTVGDVEGNSPCRRRLRYPIVEVVVLIGGKYDGVVPHVARDESAARQLGARALDFTGKSPGDDRHRRTGLLQQAQLARRRLAAANNQGGATLEVEENREIVHAIRSL